MAYAWMAEDKAPALLGQGLSFLGMRERRGKEVFLNGQDSAVSVDNGRGWVALVQVALEGLPRALG